MPKQTTYPQQKFVTTGITLAVLAFVAVGVRASAQKAMPLPAMAMNARSESARYADGTYMADGSYSSPGGQQQVHVSLTFVDNTVSAATVTGQADGGVAKFYQESFITNYMPSVVGKKVNDIHVSRVSGSSLTSQGFNDALKKIKQQAQSQS